MSDERTRSSPDAIRGLNGKVDGPGRRFERLEGRIAHADTGRVAQDKAVSAAHLAQRAFVAGAPTMTGAADNFGMFG